MACALLVIEDLASSVPKVWHVGATVLEIKAESSISYLRNHYMCIMFLLFVFGNAINTVSCVLRKCLINGQHRFIKFKTRGAAECFRLDKIRSANLLNGFKIF